MREIEGLYMLRQQDENMDGYGDQFENICAEIIGRISRAEDMHTVYRFCVLDSSHEVMHAWHSFCGPGEVMKRGSSLLFRRARST